MHPRFLSLVVVLALFAGCRDALSPDVGLVLETDSASYLFATSSGPQISVRVINSSQASVVLSTCTGALFAVPEVWTGTAWRRAPVIGCFPEQLTGLSLAPGDTAIAFTSTRSVGTFRARVPVLESPGIERVASAVSNTFVVY